MGELTKLPNIGKKVEEQLVQVGIDSADKLKRIGIRSALTAGIAAAIYRKRMCRSCGLSRCI